MNFARRHRNKTERARFARGAVRMSALLGASALVAIMLSMADTAALAQRATQGAAPLPPRRPPELTPAAPTDAPAPITTQPAPPVTSAPATTAPTDPTPPVDRRPVGVTPRPAPPTPPVSKARRSAYHACALEWESMKKSGKADGRVWRDFSAQCMSRQP